MTYPDTRRDDIVETLHGREIADPYRWLEDPDAPEVVAWVDAQRKHTETHLAELPDRAWFHEVMGRVISRPRAGIPRVHGGRYFLNRNDGTQAQDVWLVADSLEGVIDPEARVIADPNAWSNDGTVSLHHFTVSVDGRLMAQSRSIGGSDWQHITIVDLDTGEQTDEPVLVTKFADPTWLPDHQSFLYNAFEIGDAVGTQTDALARPTMMRHRLGTPQTDDELVAEFTDDDRVLFDWGTTDDDHWLYVLPVRGTEHNNRLWVYPLTTTDGVTTIGDRLVVAADDDAEYIVVGSVGEPGVDARLLVRTDLAAPLQRLVSYDLEALTRGEQVEPVTFVAEQPEVLAHAVLSGDHILAEYLVDATPQLRRFALDGTDLGAIDLPAGAFVALDASSTRPLAYVGVSTVADPTAAYEIDTAAGTARPLQLAAGERVAPPFVVERRRATSADGTEVPYFLVVPDNAPEKPAPVLLYGYGGFAIPVLADYRPGWSGWLAAGGVLAIANLRGGGEFGTEWYEDGKRANKQHVFDDCIAVAEDLVSAGITTPQQLAVHGRSNGGLLVGAVMTQRPDLFAAALPVVGVLDMLRFHKFTIGAAWISDYGDPDVAEDFEVALAYSPLHNVKEGTAYPPTLIATGDHDDRVVPLHSHKFAAALQHAQAGDAPILTRIEVATGHGAGKPQQMLAAEWADLLAFAAHHTGLSVTAG